MATTTNIKDIETNSTSPPTTKSVSPSSNKKLIIILSVMAILFVIAIFGFNYFSNSPKDGTNVRPVVKVLSTLKQKENTLPFPTSQQNEVIRRVTFGVKTKENKPEIHEKTLKEMSYNGEGDKTPFIDALIEETAIEFNEDEELPNSQLEHILVRRHVELAVETELDKEAEEKIPETLEEAINANNEFFVLKMVKAMSFGSDDDALLHTYCDTIQFSSVKGYLEVIDSEIVGKAYAKVDGLTMEKACRDGKLLAVKIFILIKKVGIDTKDKYGKTALHYASLKGLIEIVKFLVRNGYNVNLQDDIGKTALHWATTNGHGEIAKFLIKTRSCDVNIQDGFRTTVLHLAIIKGHEDIVDLLIKIGCNVNLKDKNGWTALHWATTNGHTKFVKFLVRNGRCDVNLQDTFGKTALHWATTNGHGEIAKFLIKTRSCDVNIQDINEETALHLATSKGHEDIVDLLIKIGCNVNLKDKNGWTALHLATINGFEEIVKCLVNKRSCDVNIKDINGKTVFNYATKNHMQRILLRM